MGDFVRAWKTGKSERSARISFAMPELLWKVLTARIRSHQTANSTAARAYALRVFGLRTLAVKNAMRGQGPRPRSCGELDQCDAQHFGRRAQFLIERGERQAAALREFEIGGVVDRQAMAFSQVNAAELSTTMLKADPR
jgi:hypothetical protein